MVCYPSLGIILRIYLHCTLSLYSSLSNLYLLARFSQKSGSFSAKWNQRRLICVAVLQDTDTWTSATKSDPGEDVMIHEEKQKQDVGKEIEISENEVVAAKGTGIARRIMIDYA
ncbi:hypothetical protein WN943_020861 [Citrus x changshan-huyou]